MVDRSLVSRLERAQHAAFAAMAAELKTLGPIDDLHVSRPRGGCLFVMGRGWPVNRAYGVGQDGVVDDALLEAIEDVFAGLGVAPAFETTPIDDPSLAARLTERGYRRRDGMHVFAMEPRVPTRASPEIEVEPVAKSSVETFETVVARGFAERDDGEPGPETRVFARVAARGRSMAWLARVGGEPAGGGALGITDGIAGLFGASTLPKFRRIGVQRALLDARVRAAHEAGADLVTVRTKPGTGSERNVLRAGFELVYAQAEWLKVASAN